MSYLELNKRQQTGEIIRTKTFTYENIKSTVDLIKLSKPYADGTAFAVRENTTNPFCSNGLFVSLQNAESKYNLMLRNCGVN
jgi:hypothetical protein